MVGREHLSEFSPKNTLDKSFRMIPVDLQATLSSLTVTCELKCPGPLAATQPAISELEKILPAI